MATPGAFSVAIPMYMNSLLSCCVSIFPGIKGKKTKLHTCTHTHTHSHNNFIRDLFHCRRKQRAFHGSDSTSSSSSSSESSDDEERFERRKAKSMAKSRNRYTLIFFKHLGSQHEIVLLPIPHEMTIAGFVCYVL